MNWDAVIWVTLAIVGAALIVGGFVLFRGARTVGPRAAGGSALAAGLAMWAVLLMTVPFGVTGESPDPIVRTTGSASDTVPDDPTAEPTGALADDVTVLLLAGEVATVAGVDGLSTERVDQKAAAAAVDPAQVEHIDSFDSLSFGSLTGSRFVVLTAVHFDSEMAATERIGLLLADSSRYRPLDVPIGDASGGAEPNANGIGSLIAFKMGEWTIALHTAQPDGTQPLVTMDGLHSLAEIVAGRL